MMSDTYTMRIVETLSDETNVHNWVSAAFQIGLEFGYWPQRAGPTGDESCAIACDTSGNIIGTATFFATQDNKTWIDLVYVAPVHRGRGVADALIRAITDDRRRAGVAGLMFGTGVANLAMQKTGRKAGFDTDHFVFGLTLEGPRAP